MVCRNTLLQYFSQVARQSLAEPPVVHEDERGAVFLNLVCQLSVYFLPCVAAHHSAEWLRRQQHTNVECARPLVTAKRHRYIAG
jgi:hypothetical protein